MQFEPFNIPQLVRVLSLLQSEGVDTEGILIEPPRSKNGTGTLEIILADDEEEVLFRLRSKLEEMDTVQFVGITSDIPRGKNGGNHEGELSNTAAE